MRTQFFEQAIGVFEGGGVKGAAFAGAYKEAQKAKINFVGNIGASAGSIAAALISAGFSSSELIEVMKKPFSDFLISPNILKFDNKVKYNISKLLGGNLGMVGSINYALGLHSSKAIEIWIDEILKKHLFKNPKDIPTGPVLFSHLPKSLVVLATNLKTSSFKCWSTKSTPTNSVAFAVRCSCSIPFFFQPVVGEDNAIYVDGGVIANLPLFLINELALDKRNPILCFRLIEKIADKTAPSDAIDIIKLLIPSFLNGTTEVQLNMQKYRQIIDIDTETISAIDFNITNEQISKLIANGETAVRNFIKNEQKLVIGDESVYVKNDRESLLEQTSKLINKSTSEIIIFGGDLSWIKEGFLDLLEAALRGVRINILCEKDTSVEYIHTISALTSIGAKIIQSEEKPLLKGTSIDLFSENAQMIAIEEQPYPHGRLYSLPDDSGFIRLIRDTFISKWDLSVSIGNGAKPYLMPIEECIIISTLKSQVPAYRSCNISFQWLEVENLLPLNKYLEYLKLNRVALLDKILLESGLQNSAYIKGCPWKITPPIIEKIRSGELIIIDGTHRVYHSLQNDKKQIRAIVVENSIAALPAKINSWSKVVIKFERKSRIDRYIEYDETLFRPIANAFDCLCLDR
jgi:predicted acylesterase/phospholipase RssA